VIIYGKRGKMRGRKSIGVVLGGFCKWAKKFLFYIFFSASSICCIFFATRTLVSAIFPINIPW